MLVLHDEFPRLLYRHFQLLPIGGLDLEPPAIPLHLEFDGFVGEVIAEIVEEPSGVYPQIP
uniref:Uncharacterized protein n=1 Tax=Candidatus Kentrum sp. SD TaxID=2126332 RepID=A0A450YSR9_9GAMM|nr:MAG: hypothetical protein BECKSD772F_GA0070984_104018 [Candidatus Kentron sp. SD]VFK44591.1 MAG: hypothetical protein BECKSD772E_GA0070983_104018 [Candidatus Kentron sp. SD]